VQANTNMDLLCSLSNLASFHILFSCSYGRTCHIVRILRAIINTPTIIISALGGSSLQTLAARGAAKIPPMIKPTIICQCASPVIVKKAATSDTVTKNSSRLTEPIVNLGLFPLAIKVDVTIGPQPPPPIASKNPPATPNGKSLVLTSVSYTTIAPTICASWALSCLIRSNRTLNPILSERFLFQLSPGCL